MTRDEFDALGDVHKSYEQLNKQMLMPNLPIIARVDGRAFHTFTKGLKRPYDERLTLCMHNTAKALVNQFNAFIAYTQSDEITIILPGDSEKIMFGGNKDKLNSLISATASVAFYKSLLEFLPEKANELPIFDCRVFQYPSLYFYAENLVWREADATRNSLTMACSAHFSSKKLFKVNRQQQHELLHSIGVNWNDYPAFFKRGAYFSKRDVEAFMDIDMWNKIPEKHRPESRVFIRSVVQNLELPPASTVKNFVGVIFNKENYIVS